MRWFFSCKGQPRVFARFNETHFRDGQIKESVFLIAGGASGLGAATAQHLAAAGAKVVLVDLNAEAGDKFAATVVVSTG